MLRSLLLTDDNNTVRIVTRNFKDLEVELEHFSELSAALTNLPKNRYDAIVVDDCIDEAHRVIEKALDLPSCSKSVRIALADPGAPLNAIFKTGTQVILYKPLSNERVRHGLRAVRNLMARDRRRGSKRIPIVVSARISPRHARNAAKQVLIADLSDAGAAIHFESQDMPMSGTLNLEFALPGNPDRIHSLAEIVWRDNEGNAGLRFIDMPSFARKQLCQWLKDNAEKEANASAMGNSAGV
jgi:c-di-GMP-binding flagellar brake protein YcgR